MKTKVLVDKLKDYLSSERREQIDRYNSVKRILKKLRKKEKSLEIQLENETDAKQRQRLQSKIDVVKVQRKKGVKLQKELKQAKTNHHSS